MKVILLTVFLSLVLAGFFVAFFLSQQRRRTFSSLDTDALLPFAEEESRPANRR